MPSERIQHQIDQHLDAAENASLNLDWPLVSQHAYAVLDLDSENADALVLLAAAQRALGRAGADTDNPLTSPSQKPSTSDHPRKTPLVSNPPPSSTAAIP